MLQEAGAHPSLEFAHVLFLEPGSLNPQPDTAGRLLARVQQLLGRFKAESSTSPPRALPIAGGVAVLFLRDPEAPARCALELARTLLATAEAPVRMGLHSGPVCRAGADVEAQRLEHGGIELARRVAEWADPGHILVSGAAAEGLRPLGAWAPLLHDLGECQLHDEVKLHLFNLHTRDAGNPEAPVRVRRWQSQQAAGTLTFLMTDIQGSTRLWEQHPEIMRNALARHDALVIQSVERCGGSVVRSRGEGDSFFSLFASATGAVEAAAQIQRTLAAEPWPATTPIWVRIAILTGETHLQSGDYYGSDPNRCARLRAIAHGGQTLVAESTAVVTRDSLPPGITLRDMGLHRLKDLQRPERVYQLVPDGLPAEFPPLLSLDRVPHNLPLQVTSFVGRQKEIEQAKALLAEARLLTLTGTGGTGKTRLVVQMAADLVEDYPDGVWLVELAAIADPELVPQAVARVLGTKEEAGRSLLERMAEQLSGQQLLLLLDNCEHVLDACAALVTELVRRCPRVRILASSREALGIPAEQVYRLPSLSVPDLRTIAAQPPDVLAKYEALRLFCDRATRALPSFRLTPENVTTVAQICSRLDGIPLALELAAARLGVLPVEKLSERLDDRFRLLSGGSRTALPRQQTLRALIDWSYDLLTGAERALARRLSVFAGGWTLEAAESVCAGEPIAEGDVLGLLTSLVDKSLVVFDAEQPGGRYRLLETIRQYGRDRLLEAGEAEGVRQRHFEHFLATARAANAGLNGPAQSASLKTLDEEHENLRAALDWSLGRSETRASNACLAATLAPYWELRGNIREGAERLAAAVEAAEEVPSQRAEALYWLAGFYGYGGDQAAQSRCLEESLALYRAVRDVHGTAQALRKQAEAARITGEFGRARELARRSLAISTGSQDRLGMAAALQELGLTLYATGNDLRALALLEQSVALAREVGDLRTVTVTLANLAMVLADLGDLARARELQEETLEILRGFGNKVRLGLALVNLAATVDQQGDMERARALNEEALPLFEREGSLGCTALVCLNLGEFARRERRFTEARTHYGRSLRLFRQAGEKPRMVELLDHFAALEWDLGRPDRTVALQAAADRLRGELGAPLPASELGSRRACEALLDADGKSAARGATMTLDDAVHYALAADARHAG